MLTLLHFKPLNLQNYSITYFYLDLYLDLMELQRPKVSPAFDDREGKGHRVLEYSMQVTKHYMAFEIRMQGSRAATKILDYY